METGAFLAAARQRLVDAGFTVMEEASHGSQKFDLVAIRKRLSAAKFGAAHTFFLFASFPSIDPAGLEEYSATCFTYVESAHRSGMPRGLGRAVVCFPVAILPSADASTIESVTRHPSRKHWAGMVMPVVVDLGAGQLHYLQKTPLWGAAYYRGFRKLIQELLAFGS